MKIENYATARGIVFNSQNQILVVSRDSIIWELPGGGLEYDKSSSQMCIQEVYEETGLSVEIEHFAGTFEYSMSKDDIIARTIIMYYKCKIIENENLDPNWKDLAYDVIKFRKFVNEEEFRGLNGRPSIKVIQNLSFIELKNTKGKYFGFVNYLNLKKS